MANVRNARSRVATKNSTLARSSNTRYTRKHECRIGGKMHVPIPTMFFGPNDLARYQIFSSITSYTYLDPDRTYRIYHSVPELPESDFMDNFHLSDKKQISVPSTFTTTYNRITSNSGQYTYGCLLRASPGASVPSKSLSMRQAK